MLPKPYVPEDQDGDEEESQSFSFPPWVWWVCLAILVPSLVGFGGRWAHNLRSLPEPKEPSGHLTAWSSTAWARTPVENEQCYLANNRWNASGSASGMEQETFVEREDGGDAFGWRWRSPWLVFPKIVSYPELICGVKPWDVPMGRMDGFPFHPEANGKRLTADFHIDLEATGVYDMAFSLWAVSELPAAPGTIRTEIMIWNAQAGQRPSGRQVGQVMVNGVNWEVWVNDHQHDASGENSNSWTYVAFVAEKPVLDGPLAISSFLDYAREQKLIAPEMYITDLELGNEVSEGSGFAEVHGFKVSFQ